MTLLLQALPLLALIALLASGRAGAVPACAIAMGASLPAVMLRTTTADLPAFIAEAVVQGAWLALIPCGIIAAGMVFHAAIPERPPAGSAAPPGDILFTAAFLLGPFTETVTGFGVGLVFALGVMRRAGVSGTHAALMALISQLFIPWGGLGPGTAIGAALAGISPGELSGASAWITSAMLILLLPAFWHWCRLAGHPVPRPTRISQGAWVLAICAGLVLWHRVAPWELCGALATGTVLVARLWRAAPLRQASAAAAPYLLLIGTQLALRLWPDPPSWQPIATLPGLKLTHAMVGIWLAALIQLSLRPHRLVRLTDALGRVRRPVAALLMFALLSRLLFNAGVPQGLALALAAGFGGAAPFAGPLLAGIAGFLAGTNVGANSVMMPLQAELGRLASLPAVLLPSIQNGTAFLLVSPQLTAMAAGVAGNGATQAAIWRRAWPVPLAALLVGLAVVALG